MKTSVIDGIPVYEALVNDGDCGMVRISLVDAPAVLTAWQTFKKEDKPMMFSIANEEQRLVRGVVMRADFPIYRLGENGQEYYIIYRADTIRQMAEKYLAESRQNNVDENHNGNDVEGVQMVQYFIKDTEKGIVPEGFDEIADGSLFAEFHITNDEVWAKVKDGTYTGFSLEGIFAAAPETDQRDIDEIVDELDGRFNEISEKNMSKLNNILTRLAENLKQPEVQMSCLTTDKGVLSWEGDKEIAEGVDVCVIDAEDNHIKAEDGNYSTDDGKVIVVAEGKVSEIKTAEVSEEQPEAKEEEVKAEAEEKVEEQAEEEKVEDAAEEEVKEEAEPEEKEPEVNPEEELRQQLESLSAENETLKAELESVRAELAEIKKQPAAKPAHEEFKAEIAKTGNKGLDRLAELMRG